jgi:hypothetical protein
MKYKYAELAGISVDDWKKCLYSLIFGSHLNDNIYSAVGRVLMSYKLNNLGFDINNAINILSKFKDPIDIWLKYVKQYAKEQELTNIEYFNLKVSNSNINDKLELDNNYIFNGIVYISKNSHIMNDKKMLSAFYLQGMESAFIYHLMTLLPHNTIISYEFDGLVVNMEIPEEIIQLARERSGFLTAVVVHKPFL